MKRSVCLLAASVLAALGDEICKPDAPCYSAATVVSAASGVPGALAPNTLASIYGTGLSFAEKAITSDDISAGTLPVLLPGTGVQVLVGGYYAHMYFASPGQVNFLIPANLRAAHLTLQLLRDGTAGPPVGITLRAAAPALFQLDLATVVASHLDYSVITEQTPARPGEWVILWATGLGEVTPPAEYGAIPARAAKLQHPDTFRVLLDGVAVAPDRVGYAGLAPGWGGLYQINLRLPDDAPVNPEIRLAVENELSPAGLRIWLSPAGP